MYDASSLDKYKGNIFMPTFTTDTNVEYVAVAASHAKNTKWHVNIYIVIHYD